MTQSFPSPNLSIIPMNESSFFDTPNPFQSKLFKPITSLSASKDDTNFKTNLKNESSELISSFLFSDKDKDRDNRTIIHQGIPIDKINDDNFKMSYINNNIKPCFHNKYWTDTRKEYLMNKQQRIIDHRYSLLKSKQSISTQKDYQSRISLYHNGHSTENANSNVDNSISFNIYDSEAIGVKSDWDKNLKPQLCDNDTETPQMIIDLANKDNQFYLNEGIREFTSNKNSVYNYSFHQPN